MELENEHGTVAYEVELDNGLEVMINPSDGSILGTDTDWFVRNLECRFHSAEFWGNEVYTYLELDAVNEFG